MTIAFHGNSVDWAFRTRERVKIQIDGAWVSGSRSYCQHARGAGSCAINIAGNDAVIAGARSANISQYQPVVGGSRYVQTVELPLIGNRRGARYAGSDDGFTAFRHHRVRGGCGN